MTATEPQLIYKITTAALWADAEDSGELKGMPIDVADGYMHFSTGDQLRETLRLHFKGQKDLMLLAVRTSDIADNLKWEPSRGGDLFPHLYAALPISCIVWSLPVEVDADGNTNLPEIE